MKKCNRQWRWGAREDGGGVKDRWNSLRREEKMGGWMRKDRMMGEHKN